MLKVIRRHGYEKDPVWGRLDKAGWQKLGADTKQFIKSRYKRTCAGCGERAWTHPCTLPVCPRCWMRIPKEGCLWWWKSARTKQAFDKLLDTYFDGGYDVPDDPKQRAGWKNPASSKV